MNDGRDEQSFEERLAAAKAKAGLLDSETPSSSAPDVGKAASMATQVIAELAIPIVLAMGFGWWLDKVFHCSPWLIILALPFGMAAGIRGVLRFAGSKRQDGVKTDDAPGGSGP